MEDKQNSYNRFTQCAVVRYQFMVTKVVEIRTGNSLKIEWRMYPLMAKGKYNEHFTKIMKLFGFWSTKNSDRVSETYTMKKTFI